METPQPIFNIFGSANSRDIDFLVVISSRPRPQDVTSLAESYERQLKPLLSPDGSKELDCNLGLLENGVLTWVYKGTADISNNAIFDTYRLHRQFHPCIIQRRIERNVPWLIVRTMRILVGKVTRSTIRAQARAALRSSTREKHVFLSALDFGTFTYNAKRTNAADNYKSIAFQIGQLSALLENKEFFTKEELANFNPSLRPFLERQERPDLSQLTQSLHQLMTKINTYGQQNPQIWTLQHSSEIDDE